MADSTPTLTHRFAAEVWGTFLLVFAVVSAAIFATAFTGSADNGAGFIGVALALGFAVTVGAYTVGAVSGGHFNPAVTLGLAVAGKFSWRETPIYILAQLVGGVIGSSIVYLIAANGMPGFLFNQVVHGFASTGYDELSPMGFNLTAVIIMEVVATAILVWAIMGSTDKLNPAGFAPLAIGFTLVVLNIIAVPISGGSFNPARSIATAIYGGPVALSQVWVFILAPIVGGLIAGVTYAPMFGRKGAESNPE